MVAVSRNDDHGGDMLGRMQHFVNGVIAQCRKHGLRAELILVEWNPPLGRPPLKEVLEWPQDFGPTTVRIITVPPAVHAQFPHADRLPLFQMIGKNVGIRRARGRYVLATNVDILLDDQTVIYLRDRLTPRTMLRIDRYDVPADLGKAASFDQVLAESRQRFFQINTRFGALDVRRRRFVGVVDAIQWRLLALCTEIRIFGLSDPLRRTVGWLREATYSLWRAPVWSTAGLLQRNAHKLRPFRTIPSRGYLYVRRTLRRIAKAWHLLSPWHFISERDPFERRLARSQRLHTWACGDFTLAARDDWFCLRGYPEWPMYSWHIDSAFMFVANAHEIREVALGSRYRIYHIDHSLGSGWSPHGQKHLFDRLESRRIPYLSNDDLREWQIRAAKSPADVVVNGSDWGLDSVDLPEQAILPRRPLRGAPRPAAINLATEV